MIPNVDPRKLKSMMSQMGIKTSEIDADKVVISSGDKEIVITNPQVTRIEAQGSVSFQIGGDVEEHEKKLNPEDIEISEDDIMLVSQKTGINDQDLIKDTLKSTNGDIAEAILKLSGDEK